ncbi:MAG: class I SAM-dependent methyltransferase [Gammaproteobacteria bacterium]|nr:class I SAM-dependent methyltransferase [Gammaproteobacteria bacterium]
MANSQKFWDRIAADYAKKPVDNVEDFQQKINHIQGYLYADDNVLDFACGTGTISLELANSVKSIDAIDTSVNMLAIAKQRSKDMGIKNVNYMQTDIFDAQLRPAQFDVVLAFNIFHLVPTIDKTLSRVNQLLKPGGLLISETPCIGGQHVIFRFLMGGMAKLGIVPTFKNYKADALSNLITTANFEIIENKTGKDLFLVAKKCF